MYSNIFSKKNQEKLEIAARDPCLVTRGCRGMRSLDSARDAGRRFFMGAILGARLTAEHAESAEIYFLITDYADCINRAKAHRPDCERQD